MTTRICTRDEAIDDLRRELLGMCDEEHSVCRVAQERGLFCHGFAQWKFHELKERYPQITRSRPRVTRGELEELADRWQVARSTAKERDLACDVQLIEEEFQTCKGWDEFTDEELAGFHSDICGEAVVIVTASGAQSRGD